MLAVIRYCVLIQFNCSKYTEVLFKQNMSYALYKKTNFLTFVRIRDWTVSNPVLDGIMIM